MLRVGSLRLAERWARVVVPSGVVVSFLCRAYSAQVFFRCLPRPSAQAGIGRAFSPNALRELGLCAAEAERTSQKRVWGTRFCGGLLDVGHPPLRELGLCVGEAERTSQKRNVQGVGVCAGSRVGRSVKASARVSVFIEWPPYRSCSCREPSAVGSPSSNPSHLRLCLPLIFPEGEATSRRSRGMALRAGSRACFHRL